MVALRVLGAVTRTEPSIDASREYQSRKGASRAYWREMRVALRRPGSSLRPTRERNPVW